MWTADLAALAAAYGVATEFWDQAGPAPVGAGRDGGRGARRARGRRQHARRHRARRCDERRLRDWRQALPPVFVLRQGDVGHHLGAPAARRRRARCGSSSRTAASRSDVRQVDRWVEPVEVDGVLVGEATFALPARPAHRLAPVARRAARRTTAATAPAAHRARRHPAPARAARSALRGRRGWGFAAQLYSVRSSRSWGLGDLADLADLASWSGHELGADFVLVNPLHAASPVPPMAPSPYLPVTRRFANPIYLRVEAVPEYAYLSDGGRRHRRRARRARVQVANTTADLLERDPVWAAKRAALEVVHARAADPGPSGGVRRRSASARAPASTTSPLWCALGDTYGEPDDWPEELADPQRRRRPSRPRADAGRQGGVPPLAASGCSTSSSAQAQAAARAGRHGDRRHARPRRRRAPRGRGRVGAARRAGQGRRRRRPAGHVQPDGPGLVAAAVAPGRPGRAGVHPLPRHAAHGAAACGRHPHRPRPRAVPAVVDPARDAGEPGHVRALRPRGARRHPRARGAAGRRRRHRRGPRHGRGLGAGRPARSAASSAPRSCGSRRPTTTASRCRPSSGASSRWRA